MNLIQDFGLFPRVSSEGASFTTVSLLSSAILRDAFLLCSLPLSLLSSISTSFAAEPQARPSRFPHLFWATPAAKGTKNSQGSSWVPVAKDVGAELSEDNDSVSTLRKREAARRIVDDDEGAWWWKRLPKRRYRRARRPTSSSRRTNTDLIILNSQSRFPITLALLKKYHRLFSTPGVVRQYGGQYG